MVNKFPYLQGSKTAWEVRPLREEMETKEALLDNPNFLNQNTDSNSIGMIELSNPLAGESRIRNIRQFSENENVFLTNIMFIKY